MQCNHLSFPGCENVSINAITSNQEAYDERAGAEATMAASLRAPMKAFKMWARILKVVGVFALGQSMIVTTVGSTKVL